MSTLVTAEPRTRPRHRRTAGARGEAPWRQHRWRPDPATVALHGAVILGLLALSVVVWWHVWVTGHPTTSVTCQCGDMSEELGYLAWMPYAIAHLHNPLLSHAIYAGQGGANMLANTSNLLLGTLLAPVTWLFGPVATFNVAVTIAPVASGWCFFLAARRLTGLVPVQILAAAFYGFSPTIIQSETIGHFFLAWMVFPPLAFICLHELLVTRRHRSFVSGVALGLVVVLQFFCGTELLAISGLIAAVGLVVAAALAPRRAWELRRTIAVGLGAAATTAGILLAYPVWFVIEGPQRVIGLAWPGSARLGSLFASIVSAGPGVTHMSPLARLSGYHGPDGPPLVFLGWGVVIVLGLSGVVWYRMRLAWVVLLSGAVAWSLALGPGSMHNGHETGVWLPARLLGHVPLLDEIIPARFSALEGLCAALLLVISAERWWQVGREWLARRASRAKGDSRGLGRLQGTWAAVLTLVVAGALVPVAAAYRFPFVIYGGPVPTWFVTAGEHLPANTVVLTVPYPSSGLPQAMGWQAVAGLHFRLVSGYAIVPGRDGRHSAAASPLGGADAIFDSLSFGLAGAVPSGSAGQLAEVRRTLKRWGVGVVVVTTVGRDPAFALAYFTAVFGRPPRVQDGSWAWYGRPSSSAADRRYPAGALSGCAGPSALGNV
ncbi:MAG: hypothetical protein ACRDY1_05835, partial [Acidimicrobiales bacterium]